MKRALDVDELASGKLTLEKLVPSKSTHAIDLQGRWIDHVWDFAFEGDSNVVDVYVRYLREKIDRPFGADSIETVRGAGYRFRAEDTDAAADPA